MFEKKLKVERRGSSGEARVARRKARRGVLLLVVLSMLVLFMLIGTAFLMSSSQQSKNAANSAKFNQVGNPPTKDLDSALMLVLRDTENVHSAVRYHSLLRDIYGTDGFQGVVYQPAIMNLATPIGQVTRFAGATADNPSTPAREDLGLTQGQFIDIYVSALGYKATDVIDLRHVVKIDRNPIGQLQPYSLPLTKGYFNGCLLTITSGPAAGASTRILDYEYIADLAAANATTTATRLYRFRVLAFPRGDGQPLQISSSALRSPEILDLAGELNGRLPATFIVNGRAFSGTGAGYNPFAALGQPRLNAVETVLMGSDLTRALYPEVALTPNAAYFFPCDPDTAPSHVDMRGVRIPGSGLPMNPMLTTAMSATDIKTALSQWRYPTFAGPGDVNESYDAPDFQNMALALQTVTPRPQGRVVTDQGIFSTEQFLANPIGHGKFLRFDNEDVPMPSFHRPDLLNYWNHFLFNSPIVKTAITDADERARAILDPYPNGALRAGLDPNIAALITAIKRKASLRPLRADNPNFDGGNLMSVPGDLSKYSWVASDGTSLTYPCSDIVGPWDVDNDNDGVPDSIWVDVGNPVQEAEDGTRYKALVAYLIVDLDSRLNVNAHGLADDILPPALDQIKKSTFDLTTSMNPTPGNLAHVTAAGAISSTLQLPRGLGYGPAEISLRPLFPAPLDAGGNPIYGNRIETGAFAPVDDYLAVLRGRILRDGGAIFGKYGLDLNTSGTAATAGTNYAYALRRPNWKDDPNSVPDAPMWYSGERATPGLAAQLKFFNYPWSNIQVTGHQSAFGTAPDLKARYALGLDYNGQPVHEVANDVNPNNPSLAFDLLTKSPYELDLNSAQRRDRWGVNNYADPTTAFNSTIDFSATGGQSGLSDDAPFSPTDLEKVLRAWDADAGTLPSRLWDCVSAFDPLKLGNVDYGDPNRVLKVETAAFGISNPKPTDPEYLATAQQIAGINRRLVTTDSVDLPVVASTAPNQLALAVGPDGMPGRAGVDDNGTNGPDDPAEIGTPGSDDFKSVIGKEPARATIADLLQYRIWTEARRFEMRRQNLNEGALAALNAGNYANFIAMVNERARLVLVQSPQLLSDLIAPEVIAGNRMDLNRPFGDGRDNNGDGVVDDPLEAGDPFLDMNGNGKWDNGEPFIDLVGDNAPPGTHVYTAPGDHMWSDLTANGTLGEQIGFDYTNGQVTRIHAIFAAALKNVGGVRNLESQGRQLFARQLYCLTLLLVDENYIAPWDENDPQVMTWIEAERKKLTSASPAISAPEADLIVKRKLTCRMIAQWAVNCVDMRDSDVIMTPFEYDENPWDGWGVWNDEWTKDITVAANVNKLSFLPLDGDPATDENLGEVIDWPNVPKAPNANTKKLTTLPTANIPTHPLVQTRGLVWGAERPELLITETLAYHDRRTEDLISNDTDGHDEIKSRSTGSGGNNRYKDIDLDQGLRPQGSAFVELYNPWSEQGQYPAEIYNRVDVSTNYIPTPNAAGKQGVDLSRLSNWAWDDKNNRLTTARTDSANSIKRSPVWRMIVVEEWPNAKNTGDTLPGTRTDLVLPTGSKEPAAYGKVAANLAAGKPFVPTNPDFNPLFGSDMLQKVTATGTISETRMIGPGYGTSGVPKQISGKNQFYISYPNLEREFYFTTDKSPVVRNSMTGEFDWDFSKNRANFNLRIPDRSIKLGGLTSTAPNVQTQKFIPAYLERSVMDKPVVTPILPGHYGVVGSAGTNYDFDFANPFDPTKQNYTSTIGRNETTGQANLADKLHQDSVRAHSVRRIEMHPAFDPNPGNPLKQQMLVASNGGDPKDEITMGGTYDPYAKDIGRDNELIVDQGTNRDIRNIEDSTTNSTAITGTPNNNYYLPCVTIPVEGMNISEPPWGYGPREEEAGAEEAQLKKQNGGSGTAPNLVFKRTADHKEGRYFAAGSSNTSSYDKPLDTAPELMRTGTTANYRMIHLQRLANPLLPWNPPPLLADGKTPNPEYRANSPVNPYVTVDSSSVNLTAFNGASNAEGDIDHTKQKNEAKMRPWIYGQGVAEELTDYLSNYRSGKQVWSFRSLERGAAARLNLAGSSATPATNVPQRVLWAQEPAQTRLTKPGPPGQLPELQDLIALRQMTMRFDEVPAQVQTDQKILKNFCNMVLEHSLGFGNESYGLAYTKADAPTAAAVGAPKPSRFLFTHNVDPQTGVPDGTQPQIDSTNPWLAWGNRPYVSAEELLNVPAASQASMLRMYSTMDPNAATPVNGYGLVGLGTPMAPPVTNAARWAIMNAPFGQLTNMFAVSALAAGSSAGVAADVVRNSTTGEPVLTGGDVQAYGAPNFYRILDYVQVPSRFVGTDTMLNAETFNDDPNVSNVADNIADPLDPRYSFQPPFNKVSRERDPGRVNLNTVTGRRGMEAGALRIWSEVYDGIMHRVRDADPANAPLSQFGPAWRDIVISRKGYAQSNADGSGPIEKTGTSPDVFEFGLNKNFPSIISNPIRSADAGDLVPLTQMMMPGVQASWMRSHHFNRGNDKLWGNGSGDIRAAGFGDDQLTAAGESGVPLFSASLGNSTTPAPWLDTDRNPYMMYQPLTRLGNLVTDRSNVYAVWITIGYFEVEPAPNWNDPDANTRLAVRQRFGATNNDSDAATVAGLALYNRVYPEGYMLGRELGSDTGNVTRPRGFYIIDRSEPVGFKPGEDLNVEKTIRLRRRIE